MAPHQQLFLHEPQRGEHQVKYQRFTNETSDLDAGTLAETAATLHEQPALPLQ